MKNIAIVLSAGKGTRMGSDIPKQYLDLDGKPVIYYALKAFEESIVDGIVIVAGKEDIAYVKEEIVNRFNLKKVIDVVPGGNYRFESVEKGLEACAEDTEFVYIHDGARPLLTPDMVEQLYSEVINKKAVIAACPAKDTIKIAGNNNLVQDTPDRSTLWQVQTPQVFEYTLVKDSYDKLKETGDLTATDDAMVVEKYSGTNVYLVNTGYSNIKITTPEDMAIANALLHIK